MKPSAMYFICFFLFRRLVRPEPDAQTGADTGSISLSTSSSSRNRAKATLQESPPPPVAESSFSVPVHNCARCRRVSSFALLLFLEQLFQMHAVIPPACVRLAGAGDLPVVVGG